MTVALRQQYPSVYVPEDTKPGLYGKILNSPIGDAYVTLLYGLDGADALHPLENGGHGGVDLGGYTDPAVNAAYGIEEVDHHPIRLQIGGWIWGKAVEQADSVMGWWTMICHEPDGVPKDGTLFTLLLHSPGPTLKGFGEWVEAGEELNVVDNTGLSTGPHLHWGSYVYENGTTHMINPLSAFSGSVTSAAGSIIAVQVPDPAAPFTPVFPLEDNVQVVRNLDIATALVALNIAERDATQGSGTAQVQLLSDGDLSAVTIGVRIPIEEFMKELPGFQR